MPEDFQSASKPRVVLTIAGFDPSNGAGITADLQVFAAHGMFGTSAITALTVQSTLGVAGVEPVGPETLRATLEHLVADLRPDGIKIGMLGSLGAAQTVAAFLRSFFGSARSSSIPVVLDPVLRSSSGAMLLEGNALEVVRKELVPLVSWMTPNVQELRKLADVSTDDLRGLLGSFGERHPGLHIVATGGDQAEAPTDYLREPGGSIESFRGTRIETSSTHGTGCAFSSALLCQLVLGAQSREAVTKAKAYVEGALRRAPGLGHGAGPMDLLWPLRDC